LFVSICVAFKFYNFSIISQQNILKLFFHVTLPWAATAVKVDFDKGTGGVRPGNKNDIQMESIGVDNIDEKPF